MAVVGGMFRHVYALLAQFEVGYGVGKPTLAEALPMTNIDIARTQHVPHGHFVRAGIARGDDAHEIIVRYAQYSTRFVDRELYSILAELRSMRPTEGQYRQARYIISGMFLTRTGGEFGIGRLRTRSGCRGKVARRRRCPGERGHIGGHPPLRGGDIIRRNATNLLRCESEQHYSDCDDDVVDAMTL